MKAARDALPPGLAAFALLLCLGVCGCAAFAASSGSWLRPFPAIMPLDYTLCRSLAWLAALEEDAKSLPPAAGAMLAEMKLNSGPGRLAFASLLHPVEVVTPDISSSAEIKVYLADPPDIAAGMATISRDSAKLFLRMAVIAETRHLARELVANWPKSLSGAAQTLMRLEDLAKNLDVLWKLANGEIPPADDLAAAGDSSVAALLLGRQRLGERAWQASLNRANEAARILAEENAEDVFPESAGTWLSIQILRVRAEAQSHLRQLGLAETDLSAALGLMDRLPDVPDLRALLYAQRGRLRRLKHNLDGMCADFFEACVAGNCAHLAEARRAGQCAAR